jgi:hypothetical protein
MTAGIAEIVPASGAKLATMVNPQSDEPALTEAAERVGVTRGEDEKAAFPWRPRIRLNTSILL